MAFKDHAIRTADDLERLRIEHAVSKRAFNAVRADLAKSGTIRRSRHGNGRERGTGAVTWGIAGANVSPKTRQLCERYMRERPDHAAPPPPPWRTKFRPGSPKYRRAQVAYEQYIGSPDSIEREPLSNAVDEPAAESRHSAAPGDGWQFRYEPAPPWTGPDIRAINERFGHGDGSLGVPR